MRYYSSTAGEMVLQLAIAAGDTTISVDTTAGLPVTYPYTLILDYGSTSEEIVSVTAAGGTTLTVTRGQDGTVAQSHAFGAVIRHGVTARDHRESREHEAASAGVHGVTGSVVGTSDTQTLDNKTFQPTGDHAPLVVRYVSPNAEPMVDFRDESDARMGSISDAGLNTYGSTGESLATVMWGSVANLFKQVIAINLRGTYNAIVGTVVTGASGRFIRLMSGATELFYVAASGAVFAKGVTSDGNVSVTGTVTASGALSSPTITSLTAADAALDSRVDALEAADVTIDGRLDTLEADSGWLDLTVTGFTGTVVDTVKYRKKGGIVYMRGNVKDLTPGAFQTIGTLPAGYRPAAASYFGAGSNTGTTMGLHVSTAGVVQAFVSAATGAFTGLAPIHFPVD